MIIKTARYWKAASMGYLLCLLWQEILWCGPCGEAGCVTEQCEAGDDFNCGSGYDDTFSVDDFHDTAETLSMLRDFLVANWRDVRDLDPGQVGHDFCLTRNRHGAGFWDRGLGTRGDVLTKAAHAYGEVSLDHGVTGAGNSVVYVYE